MRWLVLELTSRADSAAEYARLARSWLTEARTELFPGLSRELPDGAVLRPYSHDLDATVGPPRGTWAQIVVYRESTPFRDVRSTLYAPRRWQRVLDDLPTVSPFDIRLYMSPLDKIGRLIDATEAVSTAVSRDRDDPRWVRFIMKAPASLAAWRRSARTEENWIAFLDRWAGRLDACYGHLTDDADDIQGTALEMATQWLGIDPPTVPRCREVLRGYSWVTICAPELSGRLGGVPALTASGAFYHVRELPGGQVLLRATPLLEQYEGPAVERVFRTLAPVLLPGRADPERAPVGARLVIGADAAATGDNQQRSSGHVPRPGPGLPDSGPSEPSLRDR
jgi:hypothetical protein